MSSSTETSMSRQPLAGVLGNVTDLRGRREVHRGLFMALSLTYPDRINPPACSPRHICKPIDRLPFGGVLPMAAI